MKKMMTFTLAGIMASAAVLSSAVYANSPQQLKLTLSNQQQQYVQVQGKIIQRNNIVSPFSTVWIRDGFGPNALTQKGSFFDNIFKPRSSDNAATYIIKDNGDLKGKDFTVKPFTIVLNPGSNTSCAYDINGFYTTDEGFSNGAGSFEVKTHNDNKGFQEICRSMLKVKLDKSQNTRYVFFTVVSPK